jgi:pimeloyl-ACP methyl ester carboxylesterase
MRDAEGAASDADRPAPSWVRQGLRREADRARILLYEHPSTTEDTRLSTLADALLEELGNLRKREQQTRPVVFVGHSIGGIIVKMVLTKASRDPSFEDIYRQCYGAAFFGK